MTQSNNPAEIPAKKTGMTTRTLACCALLAAMAVVLSRLFGMMPNETWRFSIEAVPTFTAGMLFGPVAGGLVGFSADFVGCLFSGYGYNPLFCVPPILYGVMGGLFRWYLAKKVSFPRVLLALLPAVVFGSLLWQSFALTLVYFKDGPFMLGFLTRLGGRCLQFAITIVADALVATLLFRSNVFQRVGLWPPASKNQ